MSKREEGEATAQAKESAFRLFFKKVPIYTVEVVDMMPHCVDAYTEGLIFHGGIFYESTGGFSTSSIRKVEFQTGKILDRVDEPDEYFEGMTIFKEKLFQLTWAGPLGFIYDPERLRPEGSFYKGAGCGLTHDDQFFILSDCSNEIRFLDPVNFSIRKVLFIYNADNQPLNRLNELEYIKGEIFSNIHTTNWIARIDPNTGKLLGAIDLSALIPADDPPLGFLNGIAYDGVNDRLFVTGKNWRNVFEVRLKKID